MPSVFAGAQNFICGFRADKLKMRIQGRSLDGMVIQNVQFQFQQQITMLYEIGSTKRNNVYLVGGRAQGNATIGRIIGPAAGQAIMIQQYGDLCNPKPISFEGSSGCVTGGGLEYTLKAAVLTTIAVSVNVNDVVINEQLQFMFIDLDYKAQ